MANEKRLIDANALSSEVDKSRQHNPHSTGMVRVNHRNEHDHFLRMIYDAPTVDAVEVVRCAKCIHNESAVCQNANVNVCWYWGRATTADGYCDRGIEKECE